MATRNWWSQVAIAAGGLALMTACADLDTGSDENGDILEEAEPPLVDSGKGSKETEVLIPETTRVLSSEARAALVSFDDEAGTIVFDRKSAGLAAKGPYQIADPAALRVGDVVVSEPTSAAPYGVLRRVVDVSVDGDTVEVFTDEATIGDAVEQASLDVELPMAGGETVTMVPGASLEMQEDQDKALIGVGYTANWTWSLPTGFDFYTNGLCRLNEANVVNLSAAANLGLEISGFNVTRFGVWGNASQNSRLNITCATNVVDHNFTIGAYVSPVYVTYIGGVVPMVFQFSIAAVAGIKRSGEAVNLTATWSEGYEVGLGWSSSAGWGPWAVHNSSASFSATGSGALRVRSGPVFALSLFAGDIFSVYSWVYIGFAVGATGAVYGLPFLEANVTRNHATGGTTGTLYGGIESGGAAGAFVDLWIDILGWPIWSASRAWIAGGIFPEIKRAIATF